MISEKRILLVDDDESIRKSLAYFFRKKTRAFETIESAEAAEKVLRLDRDWDVVISDYKLPGKDGITFLGHAKRHMPRAKTALITAYASMDIVTEALRAGIHDFIAKPLKAGMILSAVERMTAPDKDHNREIVLHDDPADADNPPGWREDLEFTIQMVTHQMNNAFTALRGKAELGKLKSTPLEADDKFSEILDILASVETLNKELMSFGKALTKRRAVPIDVLELIRRRTFAHSALVHEAGAELRVESLSHDSLVALTCEEPLAHIFDNIFINAIQGVAGVPDRARQIAVTVGPENDKLVMQIKDNGIGMSAETLAKACASGFTTKSDGNGLGLFIARRLCRVIDASIQMESHEGKGTTVTLTLPFHREDNKTAPAN